jgi:hypothetical protein
LKDGFISDNPFLVIDNEDDKYHMKDEKDLSATLEVHGIE